METNITNNLAIIQRDFPNLANDYFSVRFIDNPEFKGKFLKTFSDLIFSQNDEMIEKLQKTRPQSLLNAIFRATESGASFAKKEVSFLPFEIYKKTIENGVERKTASGEFDALIIFDINFQKQQIMSLENCKKFFTAEVHDGMEVLQDLTSGKYIFEGKNDITRQTVGYFASFEDINGETYQLFMTCAEIVERAKFSPNYKENNYKKTSSNIHYEKIVVRNLMKNIPKISKELSSILAYDEKMEFTAFEVVEEKQKDALENAKKELSPKKEDENLVEKQKKEVKEPKEQKTPEKSEKTETIQKPDNFF